MDPVIEDWSPLLFREFSETDRSIGMLGVVGFGYLCPETWHSLLGSFAKSKVLFDNQDWKWKYLIQIDMFTKEDFNEEKYIWLNVFILLRFYLTRIKLKGFLLSNTETQEVLLLLPLLISNSKLQSKQKNGRELGFKQGTRTRS